ISGALTLLCGNHRRATAEPAERLAKRKMEIEGEVSSRLIVGANVLQQLFFGNLFAELGCRRIGSVARPWHIVLFHQIEIDFEHAHLKFLTVVTRLSMQSSFAFGGTPWPRLKMCPRLPRI